MCVRGVGWGGITGDKIKKEVDTSRGEKRKRNMISET